MMSYAEPAPLATGSQEVPMSSWNMDIYRKGPPSLTRIVYKLAGAAIGLVLACVIIYVIEWIRIQ